MIQIEAGIAESIRRELRREKLDLSAPNPKTAEPDPAFVHATNWLLREAGCDGVPEIAAVNQSQSDRPSRVALVELAGGSGRRWEATVEKATRAYYEDLGYEANISGALRAACDMFFGRILTGAVHPAVGVGCIGWYSWMTKNVPDHRVVLACQELGELWSRSSNRTAVEGEIRSMATEWQTNHHSHVPAIESAA